VVWPSKVLATTRKWNGPMEKNSQSYAPDVGRVWFTSNSYRDTRTEGQDRGSGQGVRTGGQDRGSGQRVRTEGQDRRP